MGMRKKELRVVGKPSAEGHYVLLDSGLEAGMTIEKYAGMMREGGRGNTAQDRTCPVDSFVAQSKTGVRENNPVDCFDIPGNEPC